MCAFENIANHCNEMVPQISESFGRLLVDRCELCEGADVLDVAFGRGGRLFSLAERVGPSGSVVGIDFSEGMLKETQTLLQEKGLSQVELYLMDAESLDIPEYTFDLVTCGFALAMFPKRYKALREIHRVLKPGASFSFSIWNKKCEYIQWLFKLLSEYSHLAAFFYNHQWEKMCSLNSISQDLVEESFDIVDFTADSLMFCYETSQQWWEGLWSGECRIFLDSMNEKQKESFKKAAMREVEKYRYEASLRITIKTLAMQAIKLERD